MKIVDIARALIVSLPFSVTKRKCITERQVNNEKGK